MKSESWAPGVPHDQPLSIVLIADRHHGMFAQRTFVGPRHLEASGLPDHISEEVVGTETEDEGKTQGQAGPEVVYASVHPSILHRPILGGLLVTPSGRLVVEVLLNVGPEALGADALPGNGFYRVAYRCAGVSSRGTLNRSCVVEQEQTRGKNHTFASLPHQLEFDSGGDRICSAAVESFLAVDWRARPAKVNVPWQSSENRIPRGVLVVAVVGRVRDPSESVTGTRVSPFQQGCESYL